VSNEAEQKDEVSYMSESLHLVQFVESGEILLAGEPAQEVSLHGEILIARRPTDDPELFVGQMRRIALRSEPLTELEGGGAISVAGPLEPIEFELGLKGSVGKELELHLYYPLLSERLDPACEESDAIYPQLEVLGGHLKLEWPAEKPIKDTEIQMSVELELELADSLVGAVQGLNFGPFVFTFEMLGPQPFVASQANSLSPCSNPPPGGSNHERRRLNVRFVNVSVVVSNSDLEPWVQKWVDCACKVWWEKGGVRIVPKSAIDVASFHNGQISQSQETAIIQPSPVGAGQDSDRVDIYLADELIDRPGGGVTHACGTSDAYILLEIGKARHNHYLLAHELGHVLGLRHPGPPTEGCLGYREGSYCSVMLPGKPNSVRNTENNIGVIEIPSYPLVPKEFESLGQLGGWNADAEQGFFHMVRDFPYDDGTEPSVPEAPFVNWWAHSDVWNSDKEPEGRPPPHEFEPRQYENDGDIFAVDHSPVHTEPSYSGPNHMYVRLHACRHLLGPNNQPVSDPVDVYLYLAVPGAANEPLRPLNNNNGPHLVFRRPGGSLPEPAQPKTRSVPWQIPSGYPPHCCVFAVAVSDYGHQPPNPPPEKPPQILNIINNPSNHNFWHLSSRLKSDNDVAQRNLHIANAPSSSSTTLPWLAFSNPFEEPDPARLHIDTTQALALENLVVQVDDKPAREVQMGRVVSVTLADALQSGQSLMLRLKATLPPDLPQGTMLPVDLHFFVGDQHITGYQHVLRVASLAETVAQVLDTLFGALRDVAAGCQADIQNLAEKVRDLVASSADDAEKALGELCGLAGEVAALAQSLEVGPDSEPECQAVHRYLSELAGRLLASSDSASPNLLADTVLPGQLSEQVRDLVDHIQEPAGRLVRRLERA
jgi:hypothetical protein